MNPHTPAAEPSTPSQSLVHTGERMMPVCAEADTFWEHIYRYRFALDYVVGKRVLDIACGEGYGSRAMVEHGAASVIGMDLSEQAVSHARLTYQVDARVGNALDIPLPPESIDVVVSFETIEHLPDQAAFIRQCARILTPGGLLIVSAPNRLVHHDQGHLNPFHCRELYLHELEQLLASAFTDVALFSQVIARRPFWSRASVGTAHSYWRGAAARWVRRDRWLMKLPRYWKIRQFLTALSRLDIDALTPQQRQNPVGVILSPETSAQRWGSPYRLRPCRAPDRRDAHYFIALAHRRERIL